MFLFNEPYSPSDQSHFLPYQQWYNEMMQIPPQHQLPPNEPHPGSEMPNTGLSMSPRNPPSALQGPSTPTLSHSITSPVHPPPHPSALAHSSNSLGLTSPPPTPSTPSYRLDVGSRAFVPQAATKITIRKADGTEVSLGNLTKSTHTSPTPAVSSPQSMLSQGSRGTTNRRPASICMKTEDRHKSRLAEQKQNDRLKAEAADKERREKEREEAERKDVAEEVRYLETAARLEKAQKERRRMREDQRLQKEAEALERQRLKEEAVLDGKDVDTEILKSVKDGLRINTTISSPTSDKRRPASKTVSLPQSLVLTQKAIQVDQDLPELIEQKVKSLLNELTMENFASISEQIIAWANKSEKEKDGRTLIQVIRLVYEKATDEATWSEMYARLCRKMMEQISTNVQDHGIKNAEGKPITGGRLFRKYLLNRCQEDFERGWVTKEATAAAADTKALEDEAAKAASAKTKESGTEEIVLYSDEYYTAQKAKRQGLGLIKFIGELFKLQMLTERIMHVCVKKLLGNVDNPTEEEIESLCMLLGTVGSMLDIQKARYRLDVYFSRMKELMKSPNVTPRMQNMLQVGHWFLSNNHL